MAYYSRMDVLKCGLLALGMAQAPLGCGGETVTVRGIALEGEQYIPASDGCNSRPSRYNFPLETVYGRQVIQVQDEIGVIIGNRTRKESIDVLIEPGVTIEIRDVDREDVALGVLPVSADDIYLVSSPERRGGN